ncbi:MAG: hypothetical protein ACTSVY_02215 [Candidatus Helarchaeota archaeon]
MNEHYSWFTIIDKIIKAIPYLIDYQTHAMTAGKSCGIRFFDNYSE